MSTSFLMTGLPKIALPFRLTPGVVPQAVYAKSCPTPGTWLTQAAKAMVCPGKLCIMAALLAALAVQLLVNRRSLKTTEYSNSKPRLWFQIPAVTYLQCRSMLWASSPSPGKQEFWSLRGLYWELNKVAYVRCKELSAPQLAPRKGLTDVNNYYPSYWSIFDKISMVRGLLWEGVTPENSIIFSLVKMSLLVHCCIPV